VGVVVGEDENDVGFLLLGFGFRGTGKKGEQE